MKKLFSFFLAGLTALTLNAQGPAKAKLVEKVTTNGAGKLVIPYEKYVLPNGLTVVVHEDHSDPIAHVDVTYHVGSAREQEGRSGFAHFFEHMMFQGSEHVGDEQHFKLINEAGGSLNGTTNTDRTNYFETVPSNNLELALWLEADRMGFLLDSVTQKKFEVQRATVKNERGQRYDNAPYGLVWEKIGEAMYPQGHPYSWTTIGYIEDLNRVDVNDLKNFFLRWYGPNNATLTVAGDVNTKNVIAMVEKYFGSIPRGPEVKPMNKMPVSLDKDRVISYEDNVRFPQLTIAWPGVNSWHEDEPALDALTSIISQGKGSVFYEVFVKPGISGGANLYNSTQELAGDIFFAVRTYPGHTPKEADSLLKVAFAEFEKRGVTDDDLKRFKIGIETMLLEQMQSVEGKASMLAAYATFNGNPNMIGKDMDRYNKVTKEDVMRVYNKYIKNKPAVVLTVYPKGKPELKARPDNYTIPEHKAGSQESPEYKGLTVRKAVDTFDRGKQPVSGPVPAVKAPTTWRKTYANGLSVIGTQSTEVPQTYLLLSVAAGHRQEDPAQAGISQLLTRVMDQSTMKHSAADWEKEMELLGSSMSISSGTDEINIYITSLTRNLDATLALVEEKLFMPKFDTEEFNMVKKQQLEGIASMAIQPSSMADFIYNKMIYGEGHIMAYPAMGTNETVTGITLDDVKAFYKKFFSPNISKLVAVTDLAADKVLPKLTFLEKWASTGVTIKSDKDLKPLNGGGPTTIYLFDKKDAAQSEIRVGRLALPYDATGEFYKAGLMNYPLGGNFNSRINLKLREEKGWTYGARSGFGGSAFTGTYSATGGIKWDASDSAIVEFIGIMKQYAQNGITKDELNYMKKAISQKEALSYEEPMQKLFFLKRMIDYNLPDNYTLEQAKILENITKEEIDALAKKWLATDQMVVTIVGDKAKLGERLSKLGYPVVEVDATGKVVPKTEVKQPEAPQPAPQPAPAEKEKKKKKKLKMRD
ncbi:MAG: pitrilysin family protein [Bacteroidia bacterium]